MLDSKSLPLLSNTILDLELSISLTGISKTCPVSGQIGRNGQ